MKGALKYRRGATAPAKNPRTVLEKILVPNGTGEKMSKRNPAKKPYPAPETGPRWRPKKITKMRRRSGLIPRMLKRFKEVAWRIARRRRRMKGVILFLVIEPYGEAIPLGRINVSSKLFRFTAGITIIFKKRSWG